MKTNNLSRRDFLKFLASASILLPASYIVNGKTKADEQADYPNIVILVLDALSARNMSLYGYPRNTTPNITKFANHSLVFHRHYAGGNYTTPGTASLLTGTLPWKHRALSPFATTVPEVARNNIFSIVPNIYTKFAYTQNQLAYLLLNQIAEDIDLLPPTEAINLNRTIWIDAIFNNDFDIAFRAESILRARDNPTPALVLEPILESFFQSQAISKLNKKYKTLFPKGVPYVTKGMHFSLEQTLDWLYEKIIELPYPFISYIHLWPPHDPYLPRRDFIDIFRDDWQPIKKPESPFTHGLTQHHLNEARIQYDEYIAYTDSEIGRFLERLTQNHELENTIIILTSDHGEMFERGILSHQTVVLYEPVIHIPLIIRIPKLYLRQDVYKPTSNIEILNFIKYISNQPNMTNLTNDSLSAKISDNTAPFFNLQEIYAIEAKQNSKFKPITTGTITLIEDKYKIIYYSGYSGSEPIYELYNINEDPEELHDISTDKPSILSELKLKVEENLYQQNKPFM